MNYETRCGFGYDVHRFCEGDNLTLCGVNIPHDKALKAHSDADVAIHALCDAIFSTIAEGDIGTHFPPSDDKWKNAPSSIFLNFAKEKLDTYNATLVNCDITIVCEKPKIAKHRDDMRKSLADILDIDISRVNVKATTTEGLGFEGRCEGISAYVVVSVKMPG